MNTARILSIAAIAALSSLGAQAQDQFDTVYGINYQAQTQSERTRAEVNAEAVQAVAHFKNDVVGSAPAAQATAGTALSRDAVRAEAVTAVRSGTLASGIRS